MSEPFNLDAARKAIAEGQEIAAKATAGPWQSVSPGAVKMLEGVFNGRPIEGDVMIEHPPSSREECNKFFSKTVLCGWILPEDVAFLEHARTAYPAALAMLGAACDRIGEHTSNWRTELNRVARIAELEAEVSTLTTHLSRTQEACKVFEANSADVAAMYEAGLRDQKRIAELESNLDVATIHLDSGLTDVELQAARIAELELELKRWRPLTNEEAQEAYDAAVAEPVSDEEVERIVSFVTNPANMLDNDEKATMQATFWKQKARIAELEAERDRLAAEVERLRLTQRQVFLQVEAWRAGAKAAGDPGEEAYHRCAGYLRNMQS